MESRKKKEAQRAEDDRLKAVEVKKALESAKVVLGVKTGENGKLFGSITNMDIKKALDEKNIEVDKKKILIERRLNAISKLWENILRLFDYIRK